jgi:hypothetical protein
MLNLAFIITGAEKIASFIASVISSHQEAMSESPSQLQHASLLTMSMSFLTHYYKNQLTDADKAAFLDEITNSIKNEMSAHFTVPEGTPLPPTPKV